MAICGTVFNFNGDCAVPYDSTNDIKMKVTFGFKMMNSVLKMMIFVLKMMNCEARDTGECMAGEHSQSEEIMIHLCRR